MKKAILKGLVILMLATPIYSKAEAASSASPLQGNWIGEFYSNAAGSAIEVSGRITKNGLIVLRFNGYPCTKGKIAGRLIWCFDGRLCSEGKGTAFINGKCKMVGYTACGEATYSTITADWFSPQGGDYGTVSITRE